jgi:hypothetical protein
MAGTPTARRPRGLLAIALFVVGVAGWAIHVQPWLPRVPLLTGDAGCYADGTAGLLVSDADVGTVLKDPSTGATVPVEWPEGFTARRDGSQVEVLDFWGNVKATTGRNYYLPGGRPPEGPALWAACPDPVVQ